MSKINFQSIFISLISLLTLGLPSVSAMEVSVSPPRVEVEINGKQTRTKPIKIINLSNEPVDIKVYVRNWTMNEKNQLQEASSDEQSLDQSIVFTPAKFTIPPRGSQIIRFAVRPKVKPVPGESRAVLFVEEILPENKKSDNIPTVGRFGVVIYGFSGEIKRIASLNSATVSSQGSSIQASFDILNSGNAHVRMKGQYAIWQATKYPGAKSTQSISNLGNVKSKLPANILEAGNFELPPILPNHRRQLLLEIAKKLPPGNYILDINGDLSGKQIDQGIPFTVNNSPVTSPKTGRFKERLNRNK
ncbi:fimbrial biogenesis chaperone [Calothrix sp. 336/3]|uniref:fimbrial biogenesis chaperone n=1 Tax=Calothrix sp. 336/3 TaxID=1337936 RepID=UPI0004E2E379|nr:fimbria/pilus periplasmic chaperone [Calothrix sp. 336/3]AKG22145.1 P pilus assembly protein, chaperone PapD [Calothrix sp. 336/3]